MPTAELFDRVEHAILSRYFGVEPPECARGIDIFRQVDAPGVDDQELPGGCIRLRADARSQLDDTAIDNAVARLALSDIQERLPQFAVIHGDGRIELGRRRYRRRRGTLTLFPQLLAAVNWCDSGPGISWPEVWYVAYIPLYHRHVVTSSRDSTDVSGYCDIAMGYFDANRPLLEGCEAVLRKYWEHCAYCETGPWQELLQEGLLDQGRLEELVGDIWPAPAPEADEDEAADGD